MIPFQQKAVLSRVKLEKLLPLKTVGISMKVFLVELAISYNSLSNENVEITLTAQMAPLQ